jgi:hypothetical protein
VVFANAINGTSLATSSDHAFLGRFGVNSALGAANGDALASFFVAGFACGAVLDEII